MLRVVIIDDEQSAIKAIEMILNEKSNDIEIVATTTQSKEAISLIEKNKPDIVFLDIEMPFMNGFKLLESIEVKDFEIIFVTAYNQYAVKAFKANAIDYILKPIDIDELLEGVERVRERKKLKSKAEIQQLLKTIQTPQKKAKLEVKSLNCITYLETSEITYLEADGKYTTIYLINGKKVISSSNLKYFENRLDDVEFIRPHHSFLINLKHMVKFYTNDLNLELTGNIRIPISRRKKDEFMDALTKFASHE